MKTLLFVFLIFTATIAVGQEDYGPITNFLLRKGYTFPDSAKKNNNTTNSQQWPDTLYYNTIYTSKLLGSITFPFAFTSIEKVTVTTNNNTSSSYEPVSTVSLGVGYTWFWGDFIFYEDDKITVEPKAFFGIYEGTTGSAFNKLAGLYTGGFIGVGSFSLFFGYDAINKNASIGVGGRFDLYTVSQKHLHILGKVHEVRKHKKIAPMISPE
jgi:hypothetical protein